MESSGQKRRFPPPWRVEEDHESFSVFDANGVRLAVIGYRNDVHEWKWTHGFLTPDEARRIAKGIARLPEFMMQRRGSYPERWRRIKMSDKKIPYLIKFFSEERFANQFISGNLYLNRLSFFKKLESPFDGRQDSNEAIWSWWQPYDLSIRFSLFPELEITSKDLAGPVSTAFDIHNHLHIFCMYGISVPSFALTGEKFECSEQQAAELKQLLTVDERCRQFGDFAVIVPTLLFLERLKSAVKGRYAVTARAVKYYDERIFHGSFPQEDIPFSKQRRFEYQREFRLVVDTRTKGSEPLILKIGDIRDISLKVLSHKINDMFALRLESAP